MALQRHGSQLGPLHSILQTDGRFSIRILSPEAFDVALQVSRNLFQYFGADCEIVDSSLDMGSPQGNVISVARGEDFPELVPHLSPIDLVKDHGIAINKCDGSKRVFQFEMGLGAIFLRPLGREKLELVIWAYDEEGLRQAARLVPMLPGVGQPDFIIVSKACAWDGAAGVLAMGSFDSSWNASEASFVR